MMVSSCFPADNVQRERLPQRMTLKQEMSTAMMKGKLK